MSIFKCKMCGGTIEFNEGDTVGICDSCGTKQTLPRLDNEKKAYLCDRANHFRRNNDYDKAIAVYEHIINEDNTDAEMYWSLVLCRYGIEYVEDPSSHKMIPTINRSQYTSIFDDEDYKSAIMLADGRQKQIYENEAAAINEIQKEILSISQREEPFDVFICYKETDANGRRTQDSVLATELYHELSKEGFKVFFARITLEDKLGTAYEPYIFAALNSSKVMVVIGTKPDHFNAVWVKNEWSRYLALIKTGAKKMLIPAYRDMDPYDLPDEFSHLQAQDMSKLGFMQDLIHGIKKIAGAYEPKTTVKETVVMKNENGSVQAFLDRGFMALEDGDWNKADEFFEQALNFDAKLAEAYLGKLMAELHVSKRSALSELEKPFDDNNNFQKAVRFGNDSIISELNGCITTINNRKENNRLETIYKNAVKTMKSANSESEFSYAETLFKSVSDYKDSEKLSIECKKKADECCINNIYNNTVNDINNCNMSVDSIKKINICIKQLESIAEQKDVNDAIQNARKKIEAINEKAEADRLEAERKEELHRKAVKKAKRRMKIFIRVTILVLIIGIALFFSGKYVIYPAIMINKANNLIKSEEYEQAYSIYEQFDKTNLIKENKYQRALGILDAENYDEAYTLLTEIDRIDVVKQSKYSRAVSLIDSGDYEPAYILLNGLNYKDSETKLSEIMSDYYKAILSKADVGSTVFFGHYEQDNDTSNGKEEIEWVVLAKEEDRILVISTYAIDCKQYNTSPSAVTWETCSLRKWLNETFLSNGFSTEEQAQIQNATIPADKNPIYSTNQGTATTDKVFLLSITETKKYFSSDEDRKCVPTAYAKAQGAWTSSTNCWWWLRSSGFKQDHGSGVYSTGCVDFTGYSVNCSNYCVRPAMWITLED